MIAPCRSGLFFVLMMSGLPGIVSLLAAPAPVPIPPEGYHEWLRTGKLPSMLYLQDDESANGAMISSPDLGKGPLPGFSVSDKPGKPKRCELRIGEGGYGELEKATYMPGGYVFDVVDGDVIPLFDQIYSVDLKNADSKSVILNRVTDQLPKELRPGLETRTISTVADHAMLFWQQHPKFEKRRDYDGVDLKFDPMTKQAEILLYPWFEFIHLTRPLTKEQKALDRERLRVEVKKDELLTARGRSYKVLNVVPPQDIKGVGHLVGWIELAADPVEPSQDESPNDGKK